VSEVTQSCVYAYSLKAGTYQDDDDDVGYIPAMPSNAAHAPPSAAVRAPAAKLPSRTDDIEQLARGRPLPFVTGKTPFVSELGFEAGIFQCSFRTARDLCLISNEVELAIPTHGMICNSCAVLAS
jgi:hypothetical protein